MATNLNPGDLVQVRVVFSGPQIEEAFNILNYAVLSVAGTITDQDFADDFDSTNSTSIKGMMSQDWAYEGVEVSVINRSPLPSTKIATAGAGAGVVVSNTSNTQATGLISWLTNFAGRAYRGRTYFPGVWVGAITATGFPNTTYVTGLAALATQILGYTTVTAGFNTAAIQLTLFHRLLHLVTPIVAFAAKRLFATQKRRGNYGKNRTAPI